MNLSSVAHGAITFYFIGSAFAFSPASVVPKVTKIAVGKGLDSSDMPDSMPDTETKEASETMENLSVDQQAAMFRAMMQQQQQPLRDMSASPREGGVDGKGRKIGRNRDADTIANTADVYFAQLKRDSSVRTMARIEGDDETANRVFEDEGVKELKDQIKRNPHLERDLEDTKSMIETVAEEMMIAEREKEAIEKNRKRTGPSYKKILEEKRRKNEVSTQSSNQMPAPVPVAVVSPPPSPVPQQLQVSLKDDSGSSKATTAVQPSQLMVEKGNTKSQIRTLMGMFLKHRGGSGFGSGRLRGDEIDGFETLLKEVGKKLRQEAGPRQSGVQELPVTVDTAPKLPNIAMPNETPATSTAPIPSPVAPQPQPATGIATQQALTTPAPVSEVSAMTTYNAVSIDPAVQAALQCVEGAIQMYKNSPPDLASGMLMAVRAAMLNAADKCKIVIEGDLVESKNAETTNSYEKPAAGHVEQPGVTISPAAVPNKAFNTMSTKPTDVDSNSATLRKVYDALGNASGDGKFGLGPVTSEEASDLVDLIYEMRDILMEELETGIPEPSLTETMSANNPGVESTTSKYQQMLAKARAGKTN
mmetsp:Transcript_16238/g.24538  ORF Transcript_16238/g.24538 Transcript_16238/m.24538 type:complete len:589 (+) Transcript_16238:177-1943(+)